MRTFIVGVLLLIELQYNFIHNTSLIATIVAYIAVCGMFAAIAQDIKELTK